ncbi:MAG: hypothetical protein KatS3mg001_591 [Candidatus Pacearchaeota archaeon]|nr:MAG: hypothetical protein KatS3mg001_591 [Candidatus Pacearchaeota archaeon]
MVDYKAAPYKISDIYSGGYSSFQPAQTSKYFPVGYFGMTTDPRSANILQEVSQKLLTGVKNIEIEALSQEIFDSIPKQHLKEVNRLAKLTGINVSLHGPLVDVAGFTRSGWSEIERKNAEKVIVDTLLRAKELNPDGNIIVNFHSSQGIPGSVPLPPHERTEGREYKLIYAVNKETGELVKLEPEKKFFPGEGKVEEKEFSPEKRLEILNRESWSDNFSRILLNLDRVNEIFEETKPFILKYLDENGQLKIKDIRELPSEVERNAFRRFILANKYLTEEIYSKQISNLFSKAYEYGTQEQKEMLSSISNKISKKLDNNKINPFSLYEAIHDIVNELDSENLTPKIFDSLDNFSLEKTSETFGNAAWQAYKQSKGKGLPILTIENPPAGFALSTGEELKELVRKSREKFIENAVKEGLSREAAEKEAEKIIGATWDVGHINMLRKFGYKEEEIIKESEKIAPYLKHVHLSDNFGLEHTELPMGMGNVPIKEIMEKLGEKGFEAKKIIEAGNWWQHFRTPPFVETLEAMGSPIYSMEIGQYWNKIGSFYQGYSLGMEGAWLPQINYETFGAGFSMLPKELGGSRTGAGSRISGRPME